MIPPLVLLVVLLIDGEAWRSLVAVLGFPVFLNLLISLFHRPLNRNVAYHPRLLGIDLILVAVVVALSGGWRTPYYLYALSPLLASAYLFQLRGAMVAATVFVPLYLGAVAIGYRLIEQPPNWLVVMIAVVGFYLISGAWVLLSTWSNACGWPGTNWPMPIATCR